MSDDDIVAELDREIIATEAGSWLRSVLERARDEIVALRDGYTREQMREACWNNYKAALEEAAQVCESKASPGTTWAVNDCASAIRALKRR